MEAKMKEKVIGFIQKAFVGGLALAIFPIVKVSRDSQAANLILIPLLEAGVAVVSLVILQVISYFKNRNALKIVHPKGFAFHWLKAILFGTLAFVLILEVANFNLGLILGYFFLGDLMAELSTEEILLALTPGSLIITCILSYFVGRWIGMRVYEMGFIAMAAILVFGRLIVTLIDVALLPALFDQMVTLSVIFEPIYIIITALVIIFGAFGYWRGQKARPAAYLWYLVNALPDEVQKKVVDRVYGGRAVVNNRCPGCSDRPAAGQLETSVKRTPTVCVLFLPPPHLLPSP